MQKVRSTLRLALNSAVSRGRLAYNPAEGIDHPALRTTKRPKRRFFTPEELRAILQGVDEPNAGDTLPDHQFACLIHLLAHSGLRIGEALALQWKDVDFSTGAVRVTATLVMTDGAAVRGDPKTAAGRRTMHIPEDVIGQLRVQRSTTGTVFRVNGFVFTSRTGRPQNPANILRWR